MSLTSYRAAPPRGKDPVIFLARNASGRSGRPGSDLLFRALRRSTIGAEGFHGRVRDGIGCFAPRYGHQADQTAPSYSRAASGQKASRRTVTDRVFERSTAPAVYFLMLAAGHDAQARHRAISTGQLHRLPCFHLRPINVVVYHGSQRDLVLR